ncbi:MAG: aldo/keto reductase, partial [Defluviitaleaceae bacterium]|nr:aldo/keto reductase [Defluviitaleaceae bacterium]
MKYTEYGKTGIRVSRLGFGAMRLPMREVDGKSVADEELSVPLIRHAFDLGVNYIDSAFGYCGGTSESIVGKAVKGRRDKIYISTKNPTGDCDGAAWTERLETSLKRLDTDYIDFYNYHGASINAYRSWKEAENGPIQAALKAKDQGMIRHISFSTHDKPENIIELIDTGFFDSITLQYNLLDRSNEGAIAHAKQKGLGVTVMGPVGGGRLGSPSEVIRGLLEKKPVSTAEMALRFVLANENVHIALSGMNEISQVDENVQIASREGSLTGDELLRVKEMMEENKKLASLYCTGCNYCLPCPKEINTPHIFGIMNTHKVYGLTNNAKNEYANVINKRGWVKSADASACAECGECEGKCP